MSGNIRNLRDSFLHFLADNLTGITVHPMRASRSNASNDSLQVSALNVTFHDSTYSTNGPTSQFLTLDIVHEDELLALDMEEPLVNLLQLGGITQLEDYSVSPPVQIGNKIISWNPQSVKFRTVLAPNYFHRSSVLELYIRYV